MRYAFRVMQMVRPARSVGECNMAMARFLEEGEIVSYFLEVM